MTSIPRAQSSRAIPDYLRQHFYHLYAIALADLRVDPAELRMLTEFGRQRGITKHELEDILLSSAPFEPDIPPTLEERVRCLLDLARLALVDGNVSPEERLVLERLTTLFGYGERVAPELVTSLLDHVREGADLSLMVAGMAKFS